MSARTTVLRSVTRASSFLVIGCFGVACSATMPPAELIDARAAYSKAAAGPAASLNPAELHVAEELLAKAEHTFDKDGDTWKTKDQAYVAGRRAELAEAQAEVLQLDKSATMAVQQAQAAQAKELANTKNQLMQTREQLAAATAAMSALAAMKTVQAVKQEDRGMVITLSGSVLFASAKYELLSSAQETLGNVANALTKSDPNRKIVVQGYTDSQGGDAYNVTLSQHRAETVRSYLVSHGLAPERVSAEGLGKDKPVADNGTPEGRANNRRVEIVVQPASPSSAVAEPATSTTSVTTATVH